MQSKINWAVKLTLKILSCVHLNSLFWFIVNDRKIFIVIYSYNILRLGHNKFFLGQFNWLSVLNVVLITFWPISLWSTTHILFSMQYHVLHIRKKNLGQQNKSCLSGNWVLKTLGRVGSVIFLNYFLLRIETSIIQTPTKKTFS